MVINIDTHVLRNFRIKCIADLGPSSTRSEWAQAVDKEELKGLEEGNSCICVIHLMLMQLYVLLKALP